MMKLDARSIGFAVALCVAAMLLVTNVSPDLFAVDRSKYDDVVLGLMFMGVGFCLPGAMLMTKLGRETARRYYGGPVVLAAVFAGLVVVGAYFIAYGRSGLQSLFGV
jgi:hypothetical protein